MKKSLKNLQLKKQTISNLRLYNIRGGIRGNITSDYNATQLCFVNSVPVAKGGMGCHLQ